VTEDFGQRYNIRVVKDELVFRTAHFEAERGSVLHSDIYNRELTSVLASMVAAGCAYVLLYAGLEKSVAAYIVSALTFVCAFPLFRTYVFKGRNIEVIFSRSAGSAVIVFAGLIWRKRETLSLKNITDIAIETKKTNIENPDGVAFVEKISAQHGMSIPGFGEETIFFLMKLKLYDNSERLIYTDPSQERIERVRSVINAYLNK
jgi:hypothetical protein